MLRKLYLTNVVFIFFTAIFLTPLQSSYAGYDSFTVNVPNSQGGYTTLEIKQSGNGYIGPKGERYSQFPTVYQLQAVYGTNPANEEIQRSQMIMQEADEQNKAHIREMLRQQQLIDQQIKQNIQKQQIQQQRAESVNNTLIFKTQAGPEQSLWKGTLVLSLLVILFSALYFLPSVIAFNRKHLNFTPILLINIFLGWTFLGWIVALVWSFSHQKKE